MHRVKLLEPSEGGSYFVRDEFNLDALPDFLTSTLADGTTRVYTRKLSCDNTHYYTPAPKPEETIDE